MLATSNPFDRVTPLPPVDGSDLNTALQDFGFIVHPPTLYMGYVGFSVVFAFAIAALLSGRLDSAWARLVKTMGKCSMGYFNDRHCSWQLVGLLRIRLGRMVGVGSG